MADLRKARARYGASGTGEQVAERINVFHLEGVRHVVVGPGARHSEQIERFASDVMPLLADLRE